VMDNCPNWKYFSHSKETARTRSHKYAIDQRIFSELSWLSMSVFR
jgi:hypothetical protein